MSLLLTTFNQYLLIFLILFLLLSASPAIALTNTETIQWRQWNNESFSLAQKQHKLILLDISAQWCQFCKKMAAITYQDPEVISIINKHYIAIKSDIDLDTEVQVRYGHFGVPGTIILTPQKQELNKRLGYISPQQMQWHLSGNLQDAPDTSSVQP